MLHLGLADYFVEVVVTGDTLKKNGFYRYLDIETFDSIMITKNRREIVLNNSEFELDFAVSTLSANS